MDHRTVEDAAFRVSALSDDELIPLIAAGRTAALKELYNRYKRLVFGFALRSVRQRETAEEVTLDVFTEVWKSAARYSNARAKVSTWIMGICRHRAIDAFRREASRPHVDPTSWDVLRANMAPDPTVTGDETPEDKFMSAETRGVVRRAVAGLPPAQTQALSLAFFEGLTQKEISEQLRVPLGTVKTRIRLAMKKLAEILDDA